ncbi:MULTISPECIES: TniQ family protein [unclassified Yoonia]|uniref:TniQ family protein n=1 Tax=unclassified Yoonia TaxID=2629118 RepID=UPI002AFED19C|nr:MULTISPECIES: TniQ family protein [unclassified Yoonia]
MMPSHFAKLALTVPHVPGETATSVASRLALLNGAPRLIAFCSDLGISHSGLTNGREKEIRDIAALAGHDADTLVFWTPQHFETRWFRLGRKRLKFTAFSRTQLRACPMCASEGLTTDIRVDVGHLGLWQLSSIRSCAKHRCLLVSLPVTSSDKNVFDFARLVENHRFQAPVLDPLDSALEAYLAQRILNGPASSWLDTLPVHVAAQTCDNLGVLLTLGPDAKRSEISDKEWRAAGDAGYHVLKDGPDGLNAALRDRKVGHINETGRYRTRYRFFFDWLRFRDEDRDFDVIRDLVRDFVWRNFPVAQGALVLGKPCPEQHVHSLSTAAIATGITRRQLGRRLCVKGWARPSNGTNGIELLDFIPTKVVDSIKSEFSSLLNATEAAAYLGIKRFMLTKLTQPQLIPLFMSQAKTYPLYQQADLEDFLARLGQLRQPYTPIAGWLEIATAAHRLKITTERAVTLILLHRLSLRSERKHVVGFRDFYVVLTDLRNALTLPEHGAVHPARAAQLLCLKPKTVTALIEHNHINQIVMPEPTTGREIAYACPVSIKLFAERYVSLKEHSKENRLSPADRHIRGLELEPYQLDISAETEPIYQREDIFHI